MKKFVFHIINKFKIKFINNPTIPLGRWNVETCNKKINKKVDFANEDHCGPCGDIFLVSKSLLSNKQKYNKF